MKTLKPSNIMTSINLTNAIRKSLAMGPSVRNLLNQYQLDPSKISSSGPHQTLLKGDVLAYINQLNLRPSSSDQQSSSVPAKQRIFKPNLDTSGYQPKAGPEGFSKIAKKLLET